MPKYWVTNYFVHGRFPEVGQKQKTEKKRERKTERWYNNGRLRIANATSGGAHKAAWANLINASLSNLQPNPQINLSVH